MLGELRIDRRHRPVQVVSPYQNWLPSGLHGRCVKGLHKVPTPLSCNDLPPALNLASEAILQHPFDNDIIHHTHGWHEATDITPQTTVSSLHHAPPLRRQLQIGAK